MRIAVRDRSKAKQQQFEFVRAGQARAFISHTQICRHTSFSGFDFRVQRIDVAMTPIGRPPHNGLSARNAQSSALQVI
jgi:hypothetical protein